MSVTQGQPRRRRGFELASGLLRNQIRSAGETRGFAVSRLLTHWPEIVGQEVAAMARPVKVSYAKGGFGATLTLLTTGASAPILQMQIPAIRERVNACYGYNAISRISVTQTAPTGFAEGQVAFAPAPMTSPPRDPAIARAATALSDGVHDADLRSALAALAEKVLSRPANRKG
ncbi:MAG: DUF721 domain-containing protein [Rhodobacteraceae bacterium]|nr:DUF721 domain-containing protein [Paracoccaceae bacterium]MCP5342772.1 DUF721 domain-containing protein [Paracoccaceae bacterium]